MGHDGFMSIGGIQFAKKDIASHSKTTGGNYHVTLKNGLSCIFPQQKDGARILNASLDYGNGTEVQTNITNCHEIRIFGTDKCDNINMWGSTGAVKVSGDENNQDEVFVDADSTVGVFADDNDKVTFANQDKVFPDFDSDGWVH